MSYSQNFDGVTPPALPAGWNFDTAYVTTAAQSRSAPNALQFTGTVTQNSFNNTADTNSGNIVAKGWIRFNAPGTTSGAQFIFRSSSNVVANWATTTAYRVGVSCGSAPTNNVIIIRRNAGSDTTLVSQPFVASRIPQDVWMYVEVRAETSGAQVNISVKLRREDTSEWLQGGNTWGATEVATLSHSDTSGSRITAAGYGGMRTQTQTGGTVYYDTLSQEDISNAPGQVTSLSGQAAVVLTWTAPASGGAPTDYLVEYKLTSNPTWGTYAEAVSTATTATVTGLTPNTSYDFRVTATNAAGSGTASSPITVTTGVGGSTASFGYAF